MLKNYLTVALRSLLKSRLYSAINILGLAVGLASCILIVLYVRFETSFDSWLPHSERIYQLHVRFDVPGRAPMEGGIAPGPALAALQKDFSEIEAGARMLRMLPVIKRGADVFREPLMLADPAFLDIFKLEMVSGDAVLRDPASVIISETTAHKYFGSGPALGQTLPVTFSFGPRDMRVAGVFKDLPDNTHLNINLLGVINEPDFEKMPWMFSSWTSTNTTIYIKLKPGADIAAMRAALPAFEVRNVPDITLDGNDLKVADFLTLSLMPLADLHLRSPPSDVGKPIGDAKTVATFSVVAGMILLIACINFTNLATARASQRAREVALRKVLGARRSQLITQFLTESLLTAAAAFAIAVALTYLVLPVYNNFLERDLSLSLIGSDGMMPVLLVVTAAIGLAAGLYPALYLSSFLPARILKANKSAAAEGSGRLRAALVVVQFAISIGLLICTAVVYGQTVYARNMDLGYDRSGLMVVRGLGGPLYENMRQALVKETAKLNGVTNVALSDDVPTDQNNNNNIFDIPGKPSPNPIIIMKKTVDYNFFSTYRIPLAAGRYFNESYGGDDFSGTDEEKKTRSANIILNESALSRLGFASAQDAISKPLRFTVGDINSAVMVPVTVVGVVEDVSYRSARDELSPMYFQYAREDFRTMTVRYDGVAGAEVQEAVGKLWHELAPTLPYRAEFIENLIAAQYQREEAEANMFAAFSLLAIVIGCLGLYGLAAFSAERRIKEIGIRKVLGAKVRDVIRLLVWDFSKPVLIANAIAWPLAWLLMRDWLDSFQYRIGLNPAFFAAAGFLAVIIAWATVAGHAARAGRANPIRALRYE